MVLGSRSVVGLEHDPKVFMRPKEGTRTYTYLGAEANRIADGWESLGEYGMVRCRRLFVSW
jgi:hypothetical protein